MKAAFSIWDNRIAPVFDVARQMLVVEMKSGCIVDETRKTLAETMSAWKAPFLAELGVNVLICGAISRPLQEMITAYDIRVIPFIAGDLGEVMAAWLSGDISPFAMPGCCSRGQRCHRGMRSMSKEKFEMKGEGREKRGLGRGRGGPGQGCKKGTHVADDAGSCLCPGCGHSELHERGVPGVKKQCPKCGTLMARR